MMMLMCMSVNVLFVFESQKVWEYSLIYTHKARNDFNTDCILVDTSNVIQLQPWHKYFKRLNPAKYKLFLSVCQVVEKRVFKKATRQCHFLQRNSYVNLNKFKIELE